MPMPCAARQPSPSTVLLLGLYSQPIHSFVAQRVDELEKEAVIDLARARLVAPRIVRELHVRDLRQVGLDGVGELAFHPLRVIDVVLHEQVGRADILDDVERLPRVVQVEARDVVRVDRLDQELDARTRQLARGEAQVLDERRAHARGILARRRDARQAIDLRALERARIVDRLSHAVPEFAHARRLARDAAVALRPIAGRQVVQHLREAVAPQALDQRLLRVGVREQVLDAGEARAHGGVEAVEEIDLVVEQREIGGEPGHGRDARRNGKR
jgi:hypothetical protein